MAKSPFENPNVAIRLRERSNFSAGNKADRASKVSSMIELFNHDKKGELSAKSAKTVARNWTALNHKQTQEVVKGEKRDVSSKPLVRRPSSVSITLRVPKPYIRENANNDKKLGNVTAKRQTKAAKPIQENQSKLSKSAKNAKGLQARSKAAYEMNFLHQNEQLASTENTRRSSPSRFASGVGKNNQGEESRPGMHIINPKLPWQNQNGPPMTDNTSGPKSPNFSTAIGAVMLSENGSETPKSEGRIINNARNYWERKIEPKKDLPSKSVSPNKLDPSSAKTKSTLRPWSSSSAISISPRPGLSEIENQKSAIDERLTSGKISHGSSKPLENTGSGSSRDLGYSNPSPEIATENPQSSVAERLKKFGQTSYLRPKPKIAGNGAVPLELDKSQNTGCFSPNKLPLKGDFSRATVKVHPSEKPQKTVVPMRPRFMTSAAGLRPKPYHTEEPRKILSALHGVTNARILAANFENKSISVTKSPPLSPRCKRTQETQNGANFVPNCHQKPDQPPPSRSNPTNLFKPPPISTNPQFAQNKPPEHPEKSPAMTQRLNFGNNYEVVNPIPKPEQTFTFTAADKQPSHIKQKSRHRNVIRVSSDLSTINGPGIKENLSAILSEELRRSTPDVSRKSAEGYEEVTFCGIPGERSATMQDPQNTRKWTKQHNYEEIEESFAPNERKALTANYDRIHLDKNPLPRPTSLLELSSDYSHLTFKQDLHTTRIRDKIREAFTQISKNYQHHHQKMQDNDDDDKSVSSSGDEDSDSESDIVKHKRTLDRVRTLQKTYRNTLKYKSLERELSKFEDVTIFEQVLICKIVKDPDGKFSSKVTYRFPVPPPGKNMGDEKTLAHFCFPDIDAVEPCEKMPSQSYSFMLTRENGTRKFGYCRRILPPEIGPRYPVVYCLISPLGSFGLYELILDELEQRHRTSLKRVSVFLEALFVERFPAPGRSITVDIDEPDGLSHFVLRRPYDTRLEHVDLQCLLYEVGVGNIIKIFSSLLLERRVIICGKSLSTLTACIHALRTLLYPFVWQHVFVPVLPPPMVDLCCSPTPLLIGILETSVEKLRTLPLEEVFILNLSTQEILSSMGDEMEILPRKLQTPLINSLDTYSSDGRGTTSQPSYDFVIDYESAERNTVISEAFMHLFVEMIGHYQNHFQQVIQATNAQTSRFGKIHRNFNRISFYEDVTSRSLRRFLDLFMGTQMFDGFIHSRELASPDYEGLFERRISYHLRNADASQLNFKGIKTKMKKLMQGLGKKK